MPCVFCQIVKGEIPCEKIYEDEKFLAFLDINPINKGHTLVIPKEHYQNLDSTPDYLVSGLAVLTKKLAQAVKKGVKADAFNLGLNNGRIAGQIIPHVHFHIIPRFKDDDLKPWPSKKYKEGEMEEVAQSIKKYVPVPFLKIIYRINKYVLIAGFLFLILGLLRFFKIAQNVLKYVSREEFLWLGFLLVIYSLVIYLSKTKK